jgi:hypothetical protein
VPQTLEVISFDLRVSRERIRQRQERALKAVAKGVGHRPGFITAQEYAKSQLLGFLGTDNGNTVEERFVLAIAAVSFPLSIARQALY